MEPLNPDENQQDELKAEEAKPAIPPDPVPDADAGASSDAENTAGSSGTTEPDYDSQILYKPTGGTAPDSPKTETYRVESLVQHGPEVSALRGSQRPHLEFKRKPIAPKPVDHSAIDSKVELPEEYNRPPDTPCMSYFARRLGIWDFLLALLILVGGVAAVVTTYKGIGHSWDEALYLKPATEAMNWVIQVAKGNAAVLGPEGRTQYWGGRLFDPNQELHPEVGPFTKLMIGSGIALGPQFRLDPMMAMRLPVALAFGLTLVLLYLLGAREYGKIGGFAAALFYALMPRVFGHAHIAASETLLAFTTVLVVWAFLRATECGMLAILTGIAFGLAMGTKINAWLLPFPLLFWAQIYRRRDYGSNVFAMLFIAPVVLFLIWPWLWNDTIQKLVEFVAFYTGHQSTAVYYLGKKWGFGQPPAPWHYPLVITALALPEWALLLVMAGIGRVCLRLKTRPVSVLFLLLAAMPIMVSSAPGAPKYDGERLFFSAFPFIALLAAAGYSGVVSWAVREARNTGGRTQVTWAAMVGMGIITAIGTIDIQFSHPNELNYYNRLVGGPRGAYEEGFETSYWGEAVNEDVVQYINDRLSAGDRVRTLALNELALKNLQSWGKIPEGIDFSPPDPVDWYMLQVRFGMFGQLERKLHMSEKREHRFEKQGVPRIEMFRAAAVSEIVSQVPPDKRPLAGAGDQGTGTRGNTTGSNPVTSGSVASQTSDIASTETLAADAGTTKSPAIESAMGVPDQLVPSSPAATPSPAAEPTPQVFARDPLATLTVPRSAITTTGVSLHFVDSPSRRVPTRRD